jgi:hypothetical protein
MGILSNAALCMDCGTRERLEKENAKLHAEVERLQGLWCSDCQSTGYDGSNPCCSCRGTGNVDEARALAERDAAHHERDSLQDMWRRSQDENTKLRDEVDRLRTAAQETVSLVGILHSLSRSTAARE